MPAQARISSSKVAKDNPFKSPILDEDWFSHYGKPKPTSSQLSPLSDIYEPASSASHSNHVPRKPPKNTITSPYGSLHVTETKIPGCTPLPAVTIRNLFNKRLNTTTLHFYTDHTIMPGPWPPAATLSSTAAAAVEVWHDAGLKRYWRGANEAGATEFLRREMKWIFMPLPHGVWKDDAGQPVAKAFDADGKWVKVGRHPLPLGEQPVVVNSLLESPLADWRFWVDWNDEKYGGGDGLWRYTSQIGRGPTWFPEPLVFSPAQITPDSMSSSKRSLSKTPGQTPIYHEPKVYRSPISNDTRTSIPTPGYSPLHSSHRPKESPQIKASSSFLRPSPSPTQSDGKHLLEDALPDYSDDIASPAACSSNLRVEDSSASISMKDRDMWTGPTRNANQPSHEPRNPSLSPNLICISKIYHHGIPSQQLPAIMLYHHRGGERSIKCVFPAPGSPFLPLSPSQVPSDESVQQRVENYWQDIHLLGPLVEQVVVDAIERHGWNPSGFGAEMPVWDEEGHLVKDLIPESPAVNKGDLERKVAVEMEEWKTLKGKGAVYPFESAVQWVAPEKRKWVSGLPEGSETTSLGSRGRNFRVPSVSTDTSEEGEHGRQARGTGREEGTANGKSPELLPFFDDGFQRVHKIPRLPPHAPKNKKTTKKVTSPKKAPQARKASPPKRASPPKKSPPPRISKAAEKEKSLKRKRDIEDQKNEVESIASRVKRRRSEHRAESEKVLNEVITHVVKQSKPKKQSAPKQAAATRTATSPKKTVEPEKASVPKPKKAAPSRETEPTLTKTHHQKRQYHLVKKRHRQEKCP